MDEDRIQKTGIKPLREILHQVGDMFSVKASVSGGTSPFESEDEEDFANAVVYLSAIGVSSMISCGAGADDKDPDVVVVQCGPPYRIGLPAKDYYSDGAVMQKYEASVAQVFKNLYPDQVNSSLLTREMDLDRYNVATLGKSQEVAHDVVEFEKQLAAASPDAEDADDVTVSFSVSPNSSLLIISRNTTILCL